jgi:hypothetical protein
MAEQLGLGLIERRPVPVWLVERNIFSHTWLNSAVKRVEMHQENFAQLVVKFGHLFNHTLGFSFTKEFDDVFKQFEGLWCFKLAKAFSRSAYLYLTAHSRPATMRKLITKNTLNCLKRFQRLDSRRVAENCRSLEDFLFLHICTRQKTQPDAHIYRHLIALVLA